MELSYEIQEDGRLVNVGFEGMNGRGRVTSVKQALNMLKVQNPAVGFTNTVREGKFDGISDEEYEAALLAGKCISMLWRYDGDEPMGKSTQREMNILMLLANAIEMLSKQNVLLCGGLDSEAPE